MAERRGKEPLSQVQWKEEKRVLTLEKIPVLELELSVPQLTGGGRGGERISRYYQRLECLPRFGPMQGGGTALSSLGCPALWGGPLSG